MKYRTTGPDVHHHPESKRTAKPGKIGETKLGVYDHGPDGKLRLRGQVGALATSSTAARFHGKLGSTLGRVAGKKAWIAPARVSGGGFGAQKAKRAGQLRQDRGSVGSAKR
jgi:hypothetical protein